MKRKYFLVIVTLVVSLFSSACSSNNNSPDELSINKPIESEIPENSSADKLPTSGSSGSETSSTGLKKSFLLDKDNGEIVKFYVKNIGTENVYVTINKDDKNAITLVSGDDGEISSKLSKSNERYDFSVVATPNGGDTEIEYNIYQE